jgi:hypothetical protein
LVGEHPEGTYDVVQVVVRPGAWHAYHIEEESDAELGGAPRVDEVTIDVGGVNVEGGTIGVLDAAGLTDVEFGIDEVERCRRDGNGYSDRGVHISTWGDGDHRVLVDNRDEATCVPLPF